MPLLPSSCPGLRPSGAGENRDAPESGWSITGYFPFSDKAFHSTVRFLAHDGIRLRQLAAASLRADPLHELAGPHLAASPPRRLAAETGETANLAVAADSRRVVYLRQVASPKLVQTAAWAGRTIPRRGTALGAALRGAVGDGGWVARTGAVEPDVTSIAAPVYGAVGEVVAALSVLAPNYRMTPRRVEACGRAVARQAAELSRSLGAPGAAVLDTPGTAAA